jgi:hypothetical protein
MVELSFKPKWFAGVMERPGQRQSRFEQIKIPLNLPLQKGDFHFPLKKREADVWTNASWEFNSVKLTLTPTA